MQALQPPLCAARPGCNPQVGPKRAMGRACTSVADRPGALFQATSGDRRGMLHSWTFTASGTAYILGRASMCMSGPASDAAFATLLT